MIALSFQKIIRIINRINNIMTIESLIKTWKKEALPVLIVGSLGCATAAPYQGENQGGSAGSTEEGGAAGYGGIGGSEEVCTPNKAIICQEGNVYWQDSCGELGQMYQECTEEQICVNAQCVDKPVDCSMVTPTSGCIEDNCAFHDGFENDLCKWNVNAGAPYVSGAVSEERLVIEGNAIVECKGLNVLSSDCNGDFIARYRVELLDASSGSLKISHRNYDPNFSGITITHYPFAEDSKITLDCNGYQVTAAEDYDLHTQNKLEVEKVGNLLMLYVDDVYTTKVACNATSDPTPANAMIISAGSAVLPQGMKIYDVTLYCSSN